MQNKYTGDAGDFSKFVLIRILKKRFNTGLNWCLVKDEGNNDGKHISYLKKEKSIYQKADPELFKFLKDRINGDTKREISIIEKSDILNNTKFFSELISFGTERFDWHNKSLNYLNDCDIIFYDPDNGLEVKGSGILHEKSVKYLYYHEVKQAFDAGKSLVIYQHTNRSKGLDDQVKSRVGDFKNLLGKNIKIAVYKSSMGSSRFYICIENDLDFIKLIDHSLKKINTKILDKILNY